MMIKGSLLCSVPIVKRYQVQNGPNTLGFGGLGGEKF